MKTLRPGRRGEGVVTDGPYVETKETLGGFVVLIAGSMDDMPGAAIQVQPVLGRD